MINSTPRAVITLGDYADAVFSRNSDGKLVLGLSTDPENMLTFGSDGGLYVSPMHAVFDSVAEPLVSGVATLVDVTTNDECVGTAWAVTGMNNCTATHTAGGVFSVLVGDCSLGKWGFEYQVTCESGAKSKAKVAGTVAAGIQTHTVNFANTTTANLALVLSGGGTYTVNWGDGSPDTTHTSSTTVYASRTYAAPYTGAVTVTFAACEKILGMRNTQGKLTGNVSDLPASLTYMNVQGQNTLTGNVSDLPASLTSMVVQGQNTLAAPAVPTFASSMCLISLTGAAKTQAFVDNVLAGAANVNTWTIEKSVDLRGLNAAPSAAGLASKATILSKGATSVLHN